MTKVKLYKRTQSSIISAKRSQTFELKMFWNQFWSKREKMISIYFFHFVWCTLCLGVIFDGFPIPFTCLMPFSSNSIFSFDSPVSPWFCVCKELRRRYRWFYRKKRMLNHSDFLTKRESRKRTQHTLHTFFASTSSSSKTSNFNFQSLLLLLFSWLYFSCSRFNPLSEE